MSIFDSPFQGLKSWLRRVLLPSPTLACFVIFQSVPRGSPLFSVSGRAVPLCFTFPRLFLRPFVLARPTSTYPVVSSRPPSRDHVRVRKQHVLLHVVSLLPCGSFDRALLHRRHESRRVTCFAARTSIPCDTKGIVERNRSESIRVRKERFERKRGTRNHPLQGTDRRSAVRGGMEDEKTGGDGER